MLNRTFIRLSNITGKSFQSLLLGEEDERSCAGKKGKVAAKTNQYARRNRKERYFRFKIQHPTPKQETWWWLSSILSFSSSIHFVWDKATGRTVDWMQSSVRIGMAWTCKWGCCRRLASANGVKWTTIVADDVVGGKQTSSFRVPASSSRGLETYKMPAFISQSKSCLMKFCLLRNQRTELGSNSSSVRPSDRPLISFHRLLFILIACEVCPFLICIH